MASSCLLLPKKPSMAPSFALFHCQRAARHFKPSSPVHAVPSPSSSPRRSSWRWRGWNVASPARAASFGNQGDCSHGCNLPGKQISVQNTQVEADVEKEEKGFKESWPRALAIALLSCLVSFQVGVVEVQAQPEQGWGPNPNSALIMDERRTSTDDARFGNNNNNDNTIMNKLFEVGAKEGVCEEPYGFLPCSSSIGGNLFLMLTYGYLLFTAAKFISEGSELLLEVMNPGLLGGLLLPILGAFPDSILILVSGTGGSIQQAQEEVMVGVGVLAGSSVMLLTIAWAGSLIAGRCDLTGPCGTAAELTLTRPFDPIGTGVTTDEQTRVGAWIMMASTLPFLFAQLPLLPGHELDGPQAALSGGIVATIGFLAYGAYQEAKHGLLRPQKVASPWLQKKKIEEARLQFFRSRALQRVASFPLKSGARSNLLLQDAKEGHLSETVKSLFHTFDQNKDGKIQQEELRGLVIGIGLEEAGFVPAEEQVETWLREFDLDVDGTISQHEFVTGIKKWAKRVSQDKLSYQALRSSAVNIRDSDFWAAKSNEAKSVLELLESEAGATSEEAEAEAEVEAVEVEPPEIFKRAALYMVAGAALAAAFADPMVDSVANFSAASHIPPFFVAFVVTPFASNASELVSSIIFAQRRRKRNISLTFSQVYGAITMNNTLCMAIFLALVYIRGLTWDFSSEVTVIVASTFLVGAMAGSRSTFPTWLALPVLALYPFAIAGVATLDTVLGWH